MGVRHAWRCARGHVHTDYQAALQCGPEPAELGGGGHRCGSGHLHWSKRLAEQCDVDRIWRRARELGIEPKPLNTLEAQPKAEQTDMFAPLQKLDEVNEAR